VYNIATKICNRFQIQSYLPEPVFAGLERIRGSIPRGSYVEQLIRQAIEENKIEI
jgi:hypothetical protein